MPKMPNQTDRSSGPSGDAAGNWPAVFTGAFDPITLGHLDIIRRASLIFRRLIVGVGTNPEKSSLFTLQERIDLVRACLRDVPGVEVKSFEGLAVDFVRAEGARLIVRAVRGVADMDYELTMARTNRVLEPGVETFFLAASEGFTHVSSSLIRQIASLGGRRELERFVPEPVVEPLLAKFRTS